MIVSFFFNDTATTEIYTLSLPRRSSDLSARPPHAGRGRGSPPGSSSVRCASRRSPRSEEHTSELQSRQYLVCRLLLEKKKINISIASRTHTPLPSSPHTHAYTYLCLTQY